MSASNVILGGVSRHSADGPVWLKAAARSDLSRLRSWRNRHRLRFFHKEFLTEEDQRRWFLDYQAREQDFLFLVHVGEVPAGCIGVRLLGDEWDLYNVIRGRSIECSKGCMSKALALVLDFARRLKAAPVTLKVLADNPAVGWYQANGFGVVRRCGDYVVMRHEQGPAALAGGHP